MSENGIEITLSWHELWLAATVGIMRQQANIRNGRQNKYGASDDRAWQNHIEGACGECAVAKWLNIYWTGCLGHFSAADVGITQVRTTRHDNGRLITHDSDADEDIFILVTGQAPTYMIRGWLYGSETKRAEWKDNPAGRGYAYYVPQEDLNPMTWGPW